MNKKHVHDPVTILSLQANKIAYRYYIILIQIRSKNFLVFMPGILFTATHGIV